MISMIIKEPSQCWTVRGSTKLWQTRKVNIETKMITYKIKKDNENIFCLIFNF